MGKQNLCRCEHPFHAGQCSNPEGCWYDTFTPEPAPQATATVSRELADAFGMVEVPGLIKIQD